MESINSGTNAFSSETNFELIINIIKEIQSGKAIANDELVVRLEEYAKEVLKQKEQYIFWLKEALIEERQLCLSSLDNMDEFHRLKWRKHYSKFEIGYNNLITVIKEIKKTELDKKELLEKFQQIEKVMKELMYRFLNSKRDISSSEKDRLFSAINYVFEEVKTTVSFDEQLANITQELKNIVSDINEININYNDIFSKFLSFAKRVDESKEGKNDILFLGVMLNLLDELMDIKMDVYKDKISNKDEVVNKIIEIVNKMLLIQEARIYWFLVLGLIGIGQGYKILESKDYDKKSTNIIFYTYEQMTNNFYQALKIIKAARSDEEMASIDLVSELENLAKGEIEVKVNLDKEHLVSADDRNSFMAEIVGMKTKLEQCFGERYGK